MSDPRRLAAQLGELGGQWNVIESSIPVATVSPLTLVAPARPLRYGLILALDQAGSSSSIAVTTLASNAVGSGIQLGSYGGILMLTYRDFGGLVQVPWYASAPGGTLYLCVLEILMVQ